MDYTAATKVSSCVTALTDSKASSLSEERLKELKGLLRTSDELVSYAHGLLTDRLEANHSQTRKLALQLCDVVFSRSRCFRRLLASQFSHFVELTVGHKSEKPLPSPPAAAIELRQNALACIERWHEQWGLQYPQVTVAYKYLRKHFKFPEIASRAAAAAAEAAARQQRHQSMLHQRYEVFVQEFPQQQQHLQSLLRQMQECFVLLHQPVETLLEPEDEALLASTSSKPQQQHVRGADNTSMDSNVPNATDFGFSQRPILCADTAAASGAAAGQEVSPEDQEWEDVVLGVQQSAPAAELPEGVEDPGGGGGGDEYDVDELVGDFQPERVPDPAASARQATVLEQLSDLARQAQLATSTTLLDWLRLLTQLQVQVQEQQQRQQHLRAVVDLRAQLQAALQQAASWNDSPDSAADRQHTRPQAADTAGEVGHAPHASTTDGECRTNATAAVALDQLPCSGLQPLQLPTRSGNTPPATGRITFASSLRRPAEQEVVPDVYANIQDPAAAARGIYIIPQGVRQLAEECRWVPQQHSDSDSEHLATAAPGSVSAEGQQQVQGPSTGNQLKQSSQEAASSRAVAGSAPADAVVGSSKVATGLDPALRQKLAAAAPKLPIAGDDWLLAHHGVSSHGMELYNHWGAVDSTAGIPRDRLNELVGYTASYYKPSRKKRKPEHVAAGDTVPPAAAVTALGGQDPGISAAATRRLNGGSAQRQRPLESTPAAAEPTSGTTPSAQPETIQDWTPAEGPTAQRNLTREVPIGRTLSRREAASAHNRAVLAAMTDEAVAAAVQQQLNAEAATTKGRKGRAAKPPQTKADKIRKKLMG